MLKMFDKMYKDSYSTREEKIEDFRRSVMAQKGLKRNAGSHCIFITNGVITKKFDPDLPIPQGWRRGQTKRGAK